MLIIPMGTDAPIYHWPIATVGMMLVNLAILIAVPPPSNKATLVEDEEGNVVAVEEAAPVPFEKYALTLGHGLHPLQWLTHNFLHYGWMHLIGNLVFLWAFGVVVEGKLGPAFFIAVYLAIGTLHGAFAQTLFLLWPGMEGHAAGASAVIFGLLAICMIWAPRNEVQCTWIMTFGFRVFVRQFEIRYTTLAALYIGEQILNMIWAGLFGLMLVSEAGHLLGAFWGVVVGMGMLKMNWVDCEGWDVVTLLKKRRGLATDWKRRVEGQERRKRAERLPRQRADEPEADGEGPSPEERSATALKKVRKLIDAGDYASAISAYDRSARTISNWPDGPDLVALIKEMHGRGAEADSFPLMRDYCRRYPGVAHRMRLKVAQVLIRDRQKPTAALRVLAEIPDGALQGNLDTARLGLIQQANRMVADGVLELEGED